MKVGVLRLLGVREGPPGGRNLPPPVDEEGARKEMRTVY